MSVLRARGAKLKSMKLQASELDLSWSCPHNSPSGTASSRQQTEEFELCTKATRRRQQPEDSRTKGSPLDPGRLAELSLLSRAAAGVFTRIRLVAHVKIIKFGLPVGGAKPAEQPAAARPARQTRLPQI